MTDFVRCPQCGKRHPTTADTCECGGSLSLAPIESEPDVPKVKASCERPVYIDPAQLTMILESHRLTVMDGVNVGCGIYILLPILIGLVALAVSFFISGAASQLFHF